MPPRGARRHLGGIGVLPPLPSFAAAAASAVVVAAGAVGGRRRRRRRRCRLALSPCPPLSSLSSFALSPSPSPRSSGSSPPSSSLPSVPPLFSRPPLSSSLRFLATGPAPLGNLSLVTVHFGERPPTLFIPAPFCRPCLVPLVLPSFILASSFRSLDGVGGALHAKTAGDNRAFKGGRSFSRLTLPPSIPSGAGAQMAAL